MDSSDQDPCCPFIPAQAAVPFQSYLLATLYCLFVIANGSQWATLSTITIDTASTYSISSKIIIMSSWAFTLSNLVLGIPSNFFLARKIGLSLQIAAIAMFFGLVIRILLEKSFYYYLAGQILISLGQPFLLNSSLALSGVLFKFSNRKVLATTILAISAPIGSALGMLIPPFVVTDTNVHNQLETLTIVWGIIGGFITFSVVLGFQLFKARLAATGIKLSVKKFAIQAGQTIRHKDFIILCLFFGLAMGNLNCVGSVVQLFVSPFGFSTKESGVLGAALIAAGTLASLIIGMIVSKHQKFKNYIVLLGFGHLCSFGIITLGVKMEQLAVLLIGFIASGITTLPLMSLSFEYASKIATNISVEITTGLLMFTSQCFTLTEIQLFLHLIAEKSKDKIVIWIVVLIAITFIFWISLFAIDSKFDNVNQAELSQQEKQALQNSIEDNQALSFSDNKESKDTQ